jgi:hypothetical protein
MSSLAGFQAEKGSRRGLHGQRLPPEVIEDVTAWPLPQWPDKDLVKFGPSDKDPVNLGL